MIKLENIQEPLKGMYVPRACAKLKFEAVIYALIQFPPWYWSSPREGHIVRRRQAVVSIILITGWSLLQGHAKLFCRLDSNRISAASASLCHDRAKQLDQDLKLCLWRQYPTGLSSQKGRIFISCSLLCFQ